MALEIAMVRLLDSNVGDVTIFSDDGRSINVVKAIICNHSDYFKTVLHNTTSLKAPVGYEGLKIILHYVYTYKIILLPKELSMRERFKMINTARLWILSDVEYEILSYFEDTNGADLFKLYRLASELMADRMISYAARNIRRTIIQHCMNASQSEQCTQLFRCTTCFKSFFIPRTDRMDSKCRDLANIDYEESDKESEYDAEIDELNEDQLKYLVRQLMK